MTVVPPLEPRLVAAVALAVTSLVAFVAYAVDKRRARVGQGRRVPEATLLLLGALGPAGAWAGVLLLRHKTRKPWFLARLLVLSALVPVALVVVFARS